MATISRSRSFSNSPRDIDHPRVLNSDDVEQRVILWLSTYPETVASRQHRGHDGNEPVVSWNTNRPAEMPLYNHPILVISRSAETIHFLALTSFHDKPIRKHFRKHLALSPAPAHPLFHKGKAAYRTLTFEDGVSANKPGYVKVSEVYRMQWQDAQPYWAEHGAQNLLIKLDRESFELVKLAVERLTGYKPGTQTRSTPTIPQAHISPGLIPVARRFWTRCRRPRKARD